MILALPASSLFVEWVASCVDRGLRVLLTMQFRTWVFA